MVGSSINAETWATSSDPVFMLDSLGRTASQRKMRLFACACCRRAWRFADATSKRAVQVAEKFADGCASKDDLDRVMDLLRCWSGRLPSTSVRQACFYAACRFFPIDRCFIGNKVVLSVTDAFVLQAAQKHLRAGDKIAASYAKDRARKREHVVQANLLRDIFGDVIAGTKASRSWLKPEIRRVAETIYSRRAFVRMPELGKMLEKAGCNDRSILSHCEQRKRHARGCWVLDILLDRT